MATKPMKHDDVAADKKLIKKAVALHDKYKHNGAKPTELKNFRRGGKTK
jgi:hypothetical protein